MMSNKLSCNYSNLKCHLLYFLCVFCVAFLFSCNREMAKIPEPDFISRKVIIDDANIKVDKYWDEISETYYYLSHIKHKDQYGNLLELKLETTVVDSGETIVQFSERLNKPLVAINASTVLSNQPPWPKISSGIVIKDRSIIQDNKSKNYTLGIKNNNELVAYRPGVSAQQIVKDSVINAITAFTPIIVDSRPVSNDILTLVANQLVKHPRQIIAQFKNNDILILTCGGRGYDGLGMTMNDIIRILSNLKNRVVFAYNLDGGGSTTTVIKGDLISKKIDKNGSVNRTRTNCLYIDR